MAILARWMPVVTRMDLPGDASDGHCRYLEAAVNGMLVASVYAPNGNPQPGPEFDYKLARIVWPPTGAISLPPGCLDPPMMS